MDWTRKVNPVKWQVREVAQALGVSIGRVYPRQTSRVGTGQTGGKKNRPDRVRAGCFQLGVEGVNYLVVYTVSSGKVRT
jgi:hypothetical protein